MNLLINIIIGGIIGWIASKIMHTDSQMGKISNVIVGIIGTNLGFWLAGVVGIAAYGSLARWLVAIAGGSAAYEAAAAILGSGWLKIGYAGWSFCFFYHLANGIRHLAWDVGLGFEMNQINASGWLVLIVASVATAAFVFAAIL